ncbi:DUF262 domain-containing protein [Flavihumibacter sp. UBA7668]|uniref:DUF262 domain-containing protein n=1 Tax=Flavihumibacter sp. UBA7668 TaxID=1946542 RepID=UPI0025B9CB61|nr:DUF262 domain-containing protein [Flavihumibacter sp. UBA7668]
MKTAPNNKKIREIITQVKEGKLIPRPEFQRRLVWSREDKNNFIDTILRGFPFPEIYFADGDVDLDTGEGTQLLVDGLQRVNTIFQYFSGDKELKLINVPRYEDLSKDEKQAFLQYDVAVRDLGAVSKDLVIEVFKRLNATKYSLHDIEISNAVYAGELKKFAENVASNKFFENHSVFNAADYKRMGDLRYCLTVISTLLIGYFNRDEVFEELLDRFNDDFLAKEEIMNRLENVFEFVEECGFESNSRVWKKADLFTLLVEVDIALNLHKIALQPSDAIESLEAFFSGISSQKGDLTFAQSIYYKAALQATNDRLNRVRRGVIVAGLLRRQSSEEIELTIKDAGLG